MPTVGRRAGLFSGAAIAWLVASCAGAPTPQRQQQKIADELRPAKLTATPGLGEGEIKKARVRVYADAGFRAQSVNWERNVEGRLDRINKLLRPTLGFELVVAEKRPWSRTGGGDMEAVLSGLEQLDPAVDVDFVIGFAKALPQVTSSVHKLGMARTLGRHMVVRNLNDTKEIEVLSAAFNWLSAEQKKKLYTERKRHKEDVLLLHEVGHNLGALHVTNAEFLMAPAYDNKQASFAPANATLMRLVVAKRLVRISERDPEGEAEVVKAFLDANSWGGFVAADKKQMLAALADVKAGKKPGGGDKILPLSAKVRPVDRTTYREAVMLAERGNLDAAYEKIEAMLEFYPSEGPLQVLGCRIEARRAPTSARAAALCNKAVAAAPGDPEPAMYVAISVARSGNKKAALAALDGASQRLAAAPKAEPHHWLALARAYRSIGSLTRAAQTSKLAGKTGAKLHDSTSRDIARYGVKLPRKVATYDEITYVGDIKAILKAVYGRQFATATKLARAARKKYGKTAGALAAMCDLEIRQRNYGAAASKCRAALEIFEGSSWAHYLTGLLAKRDKKTARAKKHLARAIELDDQLRHAYQVLAEIQRATGDQAGLADVKSKYRTRFGTELR